MWIRRLIYLYIILWLIEGGLRRWFLPGLATPLLLIRDPLVIFIYFVAFTKNVFPLNSFFYSGVVLAVLTFANAFIFGHKNLAVALYGIRCDFLHVPLIFIMAKVLRQKDLMVMAKVAMWLVIPYTILLMAQFYAPQDAWVNRGVGGSLDGAGFSGALDHFRPPGTFSFISGPTELYPLFTACWFVLVIACEISAWQMVLSGAAILVAVPVSISRSLFLSVAIVTVIGVCALFASKRVPTATLLKAFLALLIVVVISTQLPVFKEGMAAFEARWEVATTDNGGFQGAIIDRVLNDLFGSFQEVKFSGLGTGFSTMVGQKILTQEIGFGASEGEWGRLLFDNGLILGFSLVIYRICLAVYIVWAASKAWQRQLLQSLIFASSAFLLILNGQWGQSTTLGAAVIAGGLTLAWARPEASNLKTRVKSRLRRQKKLLPNQIADSTV
jgi:hypothetical protein